MIDIDELREAERDPYFKELLEEAEAVGERIARQGKLVIEGPVYVRPLGRGISVYASGLRPAELPFDVPDEERVELIDLIEWWLKKTGRMKTPDSDSPPLRITIEDIDHPEVGSPDPRKWQA